MSITIPDSDTLRDLHREFLKTDITERQNAFFALMKLPSLTNPEIKLNTAIINATLPSKLTKASISAWTKRINGVPGYRAELIVNTIADNGYPKQAQALIDKGYFDPDAKKRGPYTKSSDSTKSTNGIPDIATSELKIGKGAAYRIYQVLNDDNPNDKAELIDKMISIVGKDFINADKITLVEKRISQLTGKLIAHTAQAWNPETPLTKDELIENAKVGIALNAELTQAKSELAQLSESESEPAESIA